jgi:hypothetical protein
MTQVLAQCCAQAMGNTQGFFNGDLHAAFDVAGVPAGQLQERVNAATGLTGGAAWNALLSWQLLAAGGQLLTIANLFGAGGHVYKPGVGVLQGLTCGNFSDVTGLTPAVVDGLVARCNDATSIGASNPTQALAGQQPTLRSANGLSSWAYTAASNTNLSFAAPPIAMAADHAVVLAVSLTSTSPTRALFGTGGASTQRVATITVTPTLTAVWRDDAGTTVSLTGPAIAANTPFVVSARQRGQLRELRFNGRLVASSSTALGATTLTAAVLGNLPSLISAIEGSLYSAAIISSTVSDNQLLFMEAYAANSCGSALRI